MKKYLPSEIESKWQRQWREKKIFQPDLEKAKKPFYNLMMFPYPSGEGLHVGNMYAFTGADIYGRKKRMEGLDVFEPIGLDGFGIHSENYALKIKKHPAEVAKQTEKTFYRQLEETGNAYAWDNILETYDTDYYRWTQWIFIQLYKAGLVERKKAPVNWCPSCKTTLSDEQVIAGKCERCDNEVEKRELEQWFFKITKYADRLLKNLGRIDWSERTKTAQRNWIGRSEGSTISFKIKGKDRFIDVFTTRPDTIFGATFLVVAPDHPIVSDLLGTGKEVMNYVSRALVKTEGERIAEGREKTGVQTNYYAINPVSREVIPIWITDYVVMGYGTGAIMGVPAHDRRDHEFAIKYKLPIRKVIDPPNEFQSLVMRKSIEEKSFIREIQLNRMWVTPYYDWGFIVTGGDDQQKKYITIIQKHLKNRGWYADADGSLKAIIFKDKIFELPDQDSEAREFARKIGIPEKELDWQSEENYAYCFDRHGRMVNSGVYSGMASERLIERLVDDYPQAVKKTVSYHLHDWCISRQRYWGPPIPMIYCPKCGWQPVPEKDLPVELPFIKNYQPKGLGKAPLAQAKDWLKTKCPKCKGSAERETNVSDTFLDSAWYFFRYTSTDKDEIAFGRQRVKRWLPVDMYVGGQEHAVLHLMYTRFLTMVFKDLGLVDFEEPFKRFYAHGLITKDGAKMSKSRGNVVIPDKYIRSHGADTLRMYLMFLGPFDQGGDFTEAGIEGIYRFLNKVWRLVNLFSIKNITSWSGLYINGKRKFEEKDLEFMTNKTIEKVTDDIQGLRYNTAIAAMMEFVNFLYGGVDSEVLRGPMRRKTAETITLLLAPFAPHIAEELWVEVLKNKFSIHQQPWPKFDPKLVKEEKVEIVVQVNGKLRERLELESKRAGEQEAVEKLAKESEKVQKYLKGKKIKKTIFVPGKLINFVI